MTPQHPNWGKFKSFVTSRNELETAVQACSWSQWTASFPDRAGQGAQAMGPVASVGLAPGSGGYTALRQCLPWAGFPGHWATQVSILCHER